MTGGRRLQCKTDFKFLKQQAQPPIVVAKNGVAKSCGNAVVPAHLYLSPHANMEAISSFS